MNGIVQILFMSVVGDGVVGTFGRGLIGGRLRARLDLGFVIADDRSVVAAFGDAEAGDQQSDRGSDDRQLGELRTHDARR
jgi:hypothetical protein